MSSPTYEAIAFLQDDTDFDINRAAERLGGWLPGWGVSRKDKTVSVRLQGFEFRVHLADEPFVAVESQEMAEHFVACPRVSEIAQCKRRVEMTCTDPDPQGLHFNDFVFVLQAMEEFRGVILFDPWTGELI